MVILPTDSQLDNAVSEVVADEVPYVLALFALTVAHWRSWSAILILLGAVLAFELGREVLADRYDWRCRGCCRPVPLRRAKR